MEDVLRAAERRLRIDDPVLMGSGPEVGLECDEIPSGGTAELGVKVKRRASIDQPFLPLFGGERVG